MERRSSTKEYSFRMKNISACIIVIVLTAIVGCVLIFTGFLDDTGYVDSTATIVSIEYDSMSENHNVMVTYSYEGQDYTTLLGEYAATYKVGKEVKIKINSSNPSQIKTNGAKFAVYIPLAACAIAVICLINNVSKLIKLKKHKDAQENGTTEYIAPKIAIADNDFEEYSFYIQGTMTKTDYMMADKDNNYVIEGLMMKRGLASNSYTFSNKVSYRTEEHKIGMTVTSQTGITTFTTFKYDGKDIWEYLRENGIELVNKSGNPVNPDLQLFYCGKMVAKFTQAAAGVMDNTAKTGFLKQMQNVGSCGFYKIEGNPDAIDIIFLAGIVLTNASSNLLNPF